MLPDPAAALRAVRAYRLLAEALVASVAFGLPVLEIGVGLALLVGVTVRLAAVTLAVPLAEFVATVVSTWARGLQIDCGCLGNGGEVGQGRTAHASEVLRDAAMLAVALALARWPCTRLALRDRAGADCPAASWDARAGHRPRPRGRRTVMPPTADRGRSGASRPKATARRRAAAPGGRRRRTAWLVGSVVLVLAVVVAIMVQSARTVPGSIAAVPENTAPGTGMQRSPGGRRTRR